MSQMFGNYIDTKRKEVKIYLESWQSTVYSTVVFGATMVVIFWASVFLYTSFYFTFMPQEAVTWPIHFQFRSCGDKRGICSNPAATIPVLDPTRGSLLVKGQKYRVVVDLEMPESPVNQRIGMFLMNMEMKNQAGDTLRQSSRSTMLRYKSQLLHTISTVVFVPFLLYGLQEEKQTVTVELFSQYEEDPVVPLSEVLIELESHHVELYSAQLRIHAMFSGLRYFMFYYPLSAAVVGVGICMVFLATVVILSWYQFSAPTAFTPVQVPRGMGSFPNGRASAINPANTSVVTKKLDDEEEDAKGSKVMEVKPDLMKAKEEKDLSGDSSEGEEASRDSPVSGKGEGEDFEVVGSSQSKAGGRKDSDQSSLSPHTEEGEIVVRHRVQSIS